MKVYNKAFIDLCRKQDRKAQQQLFKELFPYMFRTVRRYVNNHPEAEDCVMKGFMKSFMNLEKFKFMDEKSLFYWIRRIMINEALMELRKRHNFMLSLEEEFESSGIQNEAIQKLNAEELNYIILQLPQGYRTVFCLYEVDGFSHTEIAGQLGISESTSRTQLAKAKNRLKNLLETIENENAQNRG